EEVFLRGEVLVDGALRVAGRMCDVIESCWRKTFFGEHLLRRIQEERAGVLEAPLPRPTLDHAGDSATESEKILGHSDTGWYIRRVLATGGGRLMSDLSSKKKAPSVTESLGGAAALGADVRSTVKPV